MSANANATFSYDATTDRILAEEPFLRRLALRLARRNADADDLVQETLLRAYNARDRFQTGTSMRAWLATILRRLFLTAALKEKRRATQTDTDAGDPLFMAGGGDSTPLPCSYVAFDEVLEHVDDRVKKAFVRLPDTYRAPFVLFALDGLSYAEIAARLRIPVGTVMSRIHRARRRLQRVLDGDDSDGTVRGACRRLRATAGRECRRRRPRPRGRGLRRFRRPSVGPPGGQVRTGRSPRCGPPRLHEIPDLRVEVECRSA